jgi:hypothetical protein
LKLNLAATSKQRLLALCCFAFVLVGCDQSGVETAPVKGRVTLDRRPLPNAVVQFQPDENKRPAFGGTDENGEYELYYKKGVVGARVGQHIVRITVPNRPNAPTIPERYTTKSELRAEVKPGQNQLDFELKSDAKPSP